MVSIASYTFLLNGNTDTDNDTYMFEAEIFPIAVGSVIL